MGQANSDCLQPRSLLAKNWLPMERDPNVLVHRVTQEQLQRHYIRILVKDLPRQTALFSTRMASHHPHICRLLYFHPAAAEQWGGQDHERDFREMYIYTDRTAPMRAWRRERVVTGLQGLRRLISIHGPIKITERMICENEVGEVKVWISENPVNNHPDSKYMSEEQSMGDFAAILTQKNLELANLLMGCITLKQAYERLNRHREEHSPHQNYSHRASGSGDFKRRIEGKDRNLITPYKNVFGNPPEQGMVKTQGQITPKNTVKGHEKYPQSSFIPKQADKSKPVSQINDLSKYRDFLIPKRISPNQDKIGNKSNPKLNQNNSSLEYRKREDYAEQKPIFQPHRLNEASFDGSKKNSGDYLSFTNSNKSFAFQHRFQTVSSIPAPVQNYPTPKGKHEQNWKSNNQISNVYSSQSECPKDQLKWQNSFKEERVKTGGGFDITIINNNVNNYISNITHNHITKIEKQASEPKNQATHQFKNYSRVAGQNNCTHSSNQFMKQSQKTREKQYNIPNFLQQKKKTSTQWAQQSATINQKLKSTNLSRKNTVSSNPSYQSPQFSSENNLDRIIQDSARCTTTELRQQKSFNLSKNNESSMSTQKITSFFNVAGIQPLTPTPLSSGYQGFTSFQKNHNSFEFKFPLRTKTMEFYQKSKGEPKNQELQNKSFTQNDFEQSANELRLNNKKGQSTSAQIQSKPQRKTIVQEAFQPPKIEQQQEQKRPAEKKLEFKKQLRNQFKDLLGGDAKEKPQEPVLTTLPLGVIEEKAEAKQCREGILKQKIIRKKTAFAQLKKEALKVLTDE